MPQSATDQTLAILAKLPKDVLLALLTFDPASVRVEDCLPDDEVERILSDAESARPNTARDDVAGVSRRRVVAVESGS